AKSASKQQSDPSFARQAEARPSSRHEDDLDTALARLQDRLIRGEISEATYAELKETLVKRSEARAELLPGTKPETSTAPLERHTEKVVERQVIVMRCRYCKKLTPVDLTACE